MTDHASHDDELDVLARRIADCLQDHLPEYGFDPYRYPSGDDKSVDYWDNGLITLTESDPAAVMHYRQKVFYVQVSRPPSRAAGRTEPADTGEN